MNLLGPLQKVGFTRNEALAVLLLSGTFIAGIGIRTFQSRQNQSAIPLFDYSKSDSAYYFHTQRDSSLIQKQSPAPAKSATRIQPRPTPILDINSATAQQLEALPGIGPELAQRIVAYRASVGMFATVDQLTNVKGIGKKSMERLRPFVKVKSTLSKSVQVESPKRK